MRATGAPACRFRIIFSPTSTHGRRSLSSTDPTFSAWSGARGANATTRAELQALETLVTRNYGFELFRSIEATKIRLTGEDAAAVELRRPDIAIRREITRREFEAAISALVQEARDCVLTTVAAAGLEPGDIDYVVTTGGSSLIPAFRRALRSILTSAVLTDTDTFTSVASGLALAAGGHR